jgi:hypothetical protein
LRQALGDSAVEAVLSCSVSTLGSALLKSANAILAETLRASSSQSKASGKAPVQAVLQVVSNALSNAGVDNRSNVSGSGLAQHSGILSTLALIQRLTWVVNSLDGSNSRAKSELLSTVLLGANGALFRRTKNAFLSTALDSAGSVISKAIGASRRKVKISDELLAEAGLIKLALGDSAEHFLSGSVVVSNGEENSSIVRVAA